MNNVGGINKVFLVGKISRSLRWYKTGDDDAMLCFVLTTYETHIQKGKVVEHREEHAIKLPVKYFEQELKLGQVLHIEGKLKTTGFFCDQSIRRYKTEVFVVKAT